MDETTSSTLLNAKLRIVDSEYITQIKAILNCFDIPIALLSIDGLLLDANQSFRSADTDSRDTPQNVLNVLNARRDFTAFKSDPSRLLFASTLIETGLHPPRFIGVRRTGIERSGIGMVMTCSCWAQSTPEREQEWRLQSDITRTEWTIIHDLLRGTSVNDIADRRSVKATTLRWHLKNILSKLSLNRQQELIAWCAQSPIRWLRW